MSGRKDVFGIKRAIHDNVYDFERNLRASIRSSTTWPRLTRASFRRGGSAMTALSR